MADYYKCEKCGRLFPKSPAPPIRHAEDDGIIIPQWDPLDGEFAVATWKRLNKVLTSDDIRMGLSWLDNARRRS